MCWWGATTAFEGGNPAQYGVTHGLVLAGFLWGFVLLGASALARPPKFAAALVGVGAVLVLGHHAAVTAEVARFVGTPPTTDVRVYMDYAAWLLLQGENPYAHDLTAAYGPHRATLQYATPLTDGGLTGRLAYPSLSFLVHVPAVVLGVSDRWVYLGFLAATLALLFRFADRAYRPMVLVPFLIEPRFIGYAFAGVSDGVWAFFLVAMVATWRKPTLRGVFLGLACACKQHPWILAPFLAVRVWTETEGDARAKAAEVGKLVAVSVLTFAVINAPFALWDPSAWLAGVFEPLSAPMITWGAGLSAFGAWGVIDLPRGVWGFTFYGAMFVGLWVYSRHAHWIREGVWLLPGLVLFLGHRSLTSYWYYELFPLVMAMVTTMPVSVDRRSDWRPTVGIVSGYAAAVVATLGFYASQPPALDVMVGRPMWVAGHRVNQLLVGVRNRSDHAIEPRFQVQTAAEQPLFWERRSGPEMLEAGQTATYVVGTRVPFKTFEMARGAVVSVSDAGQYWPRSAAHIRPDVDFARPDRIPNPSFAYWADGGQRPQFWGVHATPGGGARWTEKHAGVELFLGPGSEGRVHVATTILNPDGPLRFALDVPAGANQLPGLEQRYGLQIGVGDQTGLVLFGDAAGSGHLEDGRPWVMLPIERGGWDSAAVDIEQTVADLGLTWSQERARLGRFYHLDFPMRSVSIGLMFEADELPSDAVVQFGPIGQAGLALASDRYADEALGSAHPLWLAELEAQAGNEERAEALLPADIKLAALYVRLARTAAADGSRIEAIDLLAQAAELGMDAALLEQAVGVYERMGLGGEADQLLVHAIERAQRVRDTASEQEAWIVLARLVSRRGECRAAASALENAAVLGDDVPSMETIHEPCVDAP
ncbi:MAG: hypothetical protein KC912_05825 [Proteobacteria bacterium]|nr:hypothetical protein [Pseudomonadota bacterium]